MVVPARRLRQCAGIGAACLLLGCALPPAHKAPPAAAATIDWRRVPILPFGSPLQALTAPAHEVLMFGELAGQECYALDEPAPRFAGRDVDAYLLCFAHGRLSRIELEMRLPAAAAAAEFSRDCAGWQGGGEGSASPTARRCGGAVTQELFFSAELGDSPQEAGVPLWVVVADSPVAGTP
jgi:hypothetical protein